MIEKASGEGGGSAALSSVEARSDGGVLSGEGRRSLSGMRRFALREERNAVLECLTGVLNFLFQGWTLAEAIAVMSLCGVEWLMWACRVGILKIPTLACRTFVCAQ